MTSISALSTHHHQHTSPLQRLQDELQSEVSSGTISASDQSALSSALNDIDSSLQSDGASDQSSGSGPGGINLKIDDLIQQEVSSGKLTDQQAAELQNVFKSAFSHGPGGADGPPPAGGTDSLSSGNSVVDLLQQFLQALKSTLTDSTSPSTTDSGDTTSANAAASASTNSSSTANSATDLLEKFLESLKASLADSTYSGTGSTGMSSPSDPSLSGVLLNDRI